MRNFIDAACSTHPDIRHALDTAESKVLPYADPELWDELSAQVALLFGNGIGCLPLRSNTLATSLALGGSGEAVLAPQGSHPFTHEGAALARIAGKMLVPVSTGPGLKIRAATLESFGAGDGASCYHKPRISGVVIAQPTETGELYSESDLKAISKVCRSRGWKLHIDGARFPMAAAAGGPTIRQLFADGTVDSIGMGFGKAVGGRGVLLLAPHLPEEELTYAVKSLGAFDERLWEVVASATCMLAQHRWIELGARANAAAERLKRRLGLRTDASAANLIFLKLSARENARLRQQGFRFYTNFGPNGESRFATGWDTTEDDISSLTEALQTLNHDFGTTMRNGSTG